MALASGDTHSPPGHTVSRKETLPMYLWIFLTYGFLGYLLEKAFALVTRSRHTVRKGYLLLPYMALPCWRCWLCRRI